MKTKAAVLHEVHGKLVIEELDLDEPRAGEVLVKVMACSICHTDVHAIRGDIPVALPIVLGHEGAGVVEKVGPGVSSLGPGDKVILSSIAACGQCRYCLSGQPYICDKLTERIFGGILHDGTKRLRRNGNEVSHYFCQSSFSEYAVVPLSVATKVRADAPLAEVCGFGCGVSTGFGAAVKKAKIGPGNSVAIYGCGGVGLSALIGAKLCGATRLIAVDLKDEKLALARELGATHLVNASRDDPVERIREITGGGSDYGFECIGAANTCFQVLESVRPGGTAVVVGSPPFGSKVSIDPLTLLLDRTLTGCVEGSVIPSVDLPVWVDMYMEGLLPLNKLLSRTYPLEAINQAIEDLLNGVVVKPVVAFS